MRKYSDVVLDASGNVVSGATVTVTKYPSGTTATVYAADSTSGGNVNPLTTDSRGYFEFWAPTDHYSLTISKTGQATRTVSDVLLIDYEEQSWTPVDSSGAGLTLTVTTARVTKIGKRVFLSADVSYPVTANGSAAVIGGVPSGFTASGIYTGSVTTSGGGSPTVCQASVGGGGTTVINFTSAAGSALTNANFSGAIVRFNVSFETAT